jgi:hypothetical protein
MTEVFINNNRLDLVDKSVSQTFQINDIGNLDTRQTSYTNSFKVPKTPNNIRLFNGLSFVGKYHEVDLDSEQFPYGTPQARIVENGIELLSNGYAVVSDSGSNYYSINIYGNEKTFFEKLKEYTLQDVFPETIITYSASGLSSHVLSTDNFIFSILSYNPDTRTRYRDEAIGYLTPHRFEIWTERSTPQFYVKDLFQNLFNFLGYSVNHNLHSNSNFQRLLINASKGVSSFEINYGDDFDLKQVAPTLRLNKFLSEIMYRFGLLIKINERTKTVHFKNIDELITGNGIVDWSKKFHSFQKETYKLSNYGILNYFKYQDDVETKSPVNAAIIRPPNELLGSFVINNKNLQKEKTVITSLFKKPRYSREYWTNYVVYGLLYFDTPYSDGHLLDFAEYTVDENGDVSGFTESFEPSLLYRTTIPRPLGYSFRKPDGTYEVYHKTYCYKADYLETNFQDYIDNYYQEFIKLLNHTQVINAIINLNTIDIYNLDFFKKVYIKQLGGEFYLNKVKNYKSGKLTEVELVRIPTPTQSVYGGYSETSQMIGTI